MDLVCHTQKNKKKKTVRAFFQTFVGKNEPLIRVLLSFPSKDGGNQVAKTGTILRLLTAKRRGVILTQFGKQGEKEAYFLQEQKRRVLQGFSI